jgi:hypothetical protein
MLGKWSIQRCSSKVSYGPYPTHRTVTPMSTILPGQSLIVPRTTVVPAATAAIEPCTLFATIVGSYLATVVVHTYRFPVLQL